MSRALRLTAPWSAVIVGLYLLHDALVAVLLYHLQIVLWMVLRRDELDAEALLHGRRREGMLLLVLPSAFLGPATLWLWPRVVPDPAVLPAWLAANGLGGSTLLFFAAWFGLVHPVLEQLHWRPLRRGPHPWLAHLCFAGYHGLVLRLLLPTPWVLASVLLLLGASVAWTTAEERYGGARTVLLSHLVADAGFILAVVSLATRPLVA